GSGVDANETTFQITNPTADRTIIFPDADGTILLGSGTPDYLARWTAGGALGTGVTRDNNSTVGINVAPNASYRLYADGAGSITGVCGQYTATKYGCLGTSDKGVYGFVNDSGGHMHAVRGEGTNTDGAVPWSAFGLWGSGTNSGIGQAYGVYANGSITNAASAQTAYGIYATVSTAGGGAAWAGYFVGNVNINQTAAQDGYLYFGTAANSGFRNNAGSMEFQNSGGGWTSLSSLMGIGGSGTANRLAKFTAGTTIGDSNIVDNGTDITADLGAIANSDIYFRADETVELQSDNNDVILDAGGDIDISAGTSGSYARITTQGAGDDIILDPYYNAVGSAAVRSTANALDDLGTSAISWRNLYLTNGIYNTSNDIIVEPKNAASGAVRPAVDDADDLGTLSFRWRDILIGGCLYGFETNDLVMDAGGTSTNGAVRPYVTDQDDLGSTTYRWRDLFLSGDVKNAAGNRKYLFRNAADTTSATNSGAFLIALTNTGTSGGTGGISATASSLTGGDGIAVQGTASSSMNAIGTRTNYAVRGEAIGDITGGGGGTFLNNAAVYGRASGNQGTIGGGLTAYGVWGAANATETVDSAYLTNYGVYGSATNIAGIGATNTAYGLYGTATGPGTANYGVYAEASGATTNWAGYFVGNVAVASGNSLALRDSDNSNNIYLKTPATGSLTADYTLVLPVDDGAANQLLLTDGSGNLSWVSLDGAFAADSLDFTEFEDTMDLDANLALNQTTYTWGQTYTGTGAAGFIYTASGAITAGNAALELNVSNAATTIPAMLITNAGTSYALRVNDVAADTTPFVITADGTVCIGTATDQAAALYATTATSGEYGVYGLNTAAVAAAQYGVYGSKTGATVTGTGYGVYGTATGSGNDNYGSFGTASGGTRNRGAVGLGGLAAPTQNVSGGLYGETNISTGYGVYGLNTAAVAAAQYGVYGSKTGATVTGTGYGVYGTATGTATTNYGVYGTASAGTNNYAVYGTTSAGAGYGVYGLSTNAAGGTTAFGVYGGSTGAMGAAGTKYGMFAVASSSAGSNTAVYATADGATDNYGVNATTTTAAGQTGTAVYGSATGAGTTNYGVIGKATGATTNYSGFFDNAQVHMANLAADPGAGSTSEGSMYWNSGSNILKVYDGASWLTVAASSTGLFLAKDAVDTSSAAVAGYLYTFTNSNAVAGAGGLSVVTSGTGATSYGISADTAGTYGFYTPDGIKVDGTLLDLGTTNTATTMNLGTGTAGNAINIGTGANTVAQTISIGNGASAANSTVNILSGVGTLGAGALALGNNTRVTTIGIGNVAPAAARTITIAGGDAAVNDTVNILAGAPSLNTQTLNVMSGVATGGTQTVNILTGTGGTKNLNLGTGASAKTITMGNTTLATSLALRTGTGNFSLDGVAGSTYAIGASTTTGTITIGGTAQTGAITLGSSTGAGIVNIGTGAGGETINIDNNATAADT
ncbi:MAG: hypothetical protein RDV41_11240, partial [Planctomycetota bacterium]|nr:hypothetical protein [Planctomycetota bacterium]